MTETKSLRELKLKQPGKIVQINATGELGRRIRDMGLVPGVVVLPTRRAPLNDPVSLKVHNFTLALRNNEADYIFVQELEN